MKAQSIIQRDSILAELEIHNIQAITTPRDMSRKVTENTVDLSLSGYSVFFDGFSIYVQEEDKAKADEIISRFLKETSNTKVEPTDEVPHLRRFFFCSIFSLMVPVIMNIYAAYHLYMAFKKHEPIKNPIQFVIGLLLFLVMPILVASYIFD